MSVQKYHHGDLKTQLIHEGLKLLDAEGYNGFTLRKVAAMCGVSQTAPYRHYKNKDDLIAAITNHALDAFGKRLQSAVDMHPGEPMAQLTEMGVAYIRFFAANPEYLRLLFLSDISLRKRFAGDDGCRQHVHSFAILNDTVADLKQANPDIPLSQDELILHSWGLVHGISTLIVSGEIQNNNTTLAQAEKIVRGLYR